MEGGKTKTKWSSWDWRKEYLKVISDITEAGCINQAVALSKCIKTPGKYSCHKEVLFPFFVLLLC